VTSAQEARTTAELPLRAARPGFRLARLEVFNWGTFDGQVWGLDTRGDNTLLTGDIGSGKSTLVDAVTTLLVPPQKLAYNKAAGADARERTLRSYVLGYYKSERGETGSAARAVPLRDKDTYSVLLARFVNESFGHTVTLAQVFWVKDVEGQPARMYVVADEALSIAEHFSGFGSDIQHLKKRLRRSGFETEDSFPPYAAAFRRRFGIDNEQALELFHQTVSMKSVGNLTDFVRQHMLQPFPVEPRITALIGHFDDLNRAHEAVLKAKGQIADLIPIVDDCDRHAALRAEVDALRVCREALRPWFARAKIALLERRLENLGAELARLDERIRGLEEKRGHSSAERDDLKRAIAANGGDRIQSIEAEISRLEVDLGERRSRAERYGELAREVGLSAALDVEAFMSNRASAEAAREQCDADHALAQNAHTDTSVEFRRLKAEHDEVDREIASLRQRRSNIPARMLAMREKLCDALGLQDDEIPFAGELLQVQPAERAWEGAIERLLHGFGVSLLVPDAHYASVAQWVDRTHLGDRLVYYRVRPQRAAERSALHPRSLVHKVDVRPDSQFWSWLDAELARRFDYACCDTLDDFRREARAITKAGQWKAGGERHEKDDRSRIDDRSRYVLGWTNEQKIAALEKQKRDLEARMQALASRIAELDSKQSALRERMGRLRELCVFESFREIDWRPIAGRIDDLQAERRRLQSESNVLAALSSKLAEVDQKLLEIGASLSEASAARGGVQERRDAASALKKDCQASLEATPEEVRAQLDRVEPIVIGALGEQNLTVESCDNRERDVRDHVQRRIDAEEHKVSRLLEKIVQAMQAFRARYPLDTREMDASVAAAGEYAAMLDRLRVDDLPRFEGRFKELLNENTIREVAGFQGQLARERQDIKERIETINASLVDIDYNPGRYIVLLADPSTDPEVREFQQDLRACTEGTLTGSDDEAYSEAKFLQVKRIIERFRGREGTAELDARWTRKVTDVRQWFTFSASEQWREDGRVHEHYSDSGGKSGGQKEKLAYTVLAASLAYQFGLEWGGARARSFRFVVIDEAFGRGSDESTRYGLELFGRLDLQLLVVTPLQKIHVIEPYIASVGFVHNEEGRKSLLRNLTIEEFRAERAARTA
jgi:uncharacterized protein YPO0396